jgi:phage terminase small subunit
MPVNELQERFVQEYMLDLNIGAAAVRAGYREARDGYTLMELDAVRERIREAQEERAKRLEVKSDWVVQQLRMIVERCMELEPVTDKGQLVLETDAFGEVRAIVKFNAAGATKALELLGKHIGMFTDKVEHSGSIDMAEPSQNEVARRLAFILHQAVKQQGQTIQ